MSVSAVGRHGRKSVSISAVGWHGRKSVSVSAAVLVRQEVCVRFSCGVGAAGSLCPFQPWGGAAGSLCPVSATGIQKAEGLAIASQGVAVH